MAGMDELPEITVQYAMIPNASNAMDFIRDRLVVVVFLTSQEHTGNGPAIVNVNQMRYILSELMNVVAVVSLVILVLDFPQRVHHVAPVAVLLNIYSITQQSAYHFARRLIP